MGQDSLDRHVYRGHFQLSPCQTNSGRSRIRRLHRTSSTSPTQQSFWSTPTMMLGLQGVPTNEREHCARRVVQDINCVKKSVPSKNWRLCARHLEDIFPSPVGCTWTQRGSWGDPFAPRHGCPKTRARERLDGPLGWIDSLPLLLQTMPSSCIPPRTTQRCHVAKADGASFSTIY